VLKRSSLENINISDLENVRKLEDMRSPPDLELFILLTAFTVLELNSRFRNPRRYPFTDDDIKNGLKLLSGQKYWGEKWSKVTDLERSKESRWRWSRMGVYWYMIHRSKHKTSCCRAYAARRAINN